MIIKLTKSKVCLISEQDADLAQLRWYFSGKYAIRKTGPSGKNIRLHRLVMSRILGRPITAKEQVDHVDGNKLDNRRFNLRLATDSENKANKPRQNNNKSGYKGVSWHKRAKKWKSEIQINGQKIYLGLFDDPKVAALTYDAVAKLRFGEFAKVNI